MDKDKDLLPCPFCGGQAESHQWWSATISGKYAAICTECNSGTDYYDTEAEAIAAWNTRAATTIGKVQVEIEPVLHGTLTAEQVMMIAGKHQPDYCSDTHVCFDWQAIADELNAATGGEINGDTSDGNLRERIDHLEEVNGSLCAEINRQERMIRELESLVRDMLPWVWESGIGAAEYDSITERAAELGIGEGR